MSIMDMMKIFLCGFLSVILLSGCCCHYTPSDQAHFRNIQKEKFAIRYNALSFESCKGEKAVRLTMQDIGTDIPFDIAPARARFTLTTISPAFVKEKWDKWRNEASIEIIPLTDPSAPNFEEAYPDLQSSVRGLREVLKEGVVRTTVSQQFPDWNCVDSEQTIHSKTQIIDTPWCSGVQFLTTYVQEASEVSNENLMFRFEGISKDSLYFIAIQIPLAHASLPFAAPGIADADQAKVIDYYSQTEAKLNQIDDAEFVPSLISLRELIESIHPIK
jgi:hypothetical protein